jgi:hypothetical protein
MNLLTVIILLFFQTAFPTVDTTPIPTLLPPPQVEDLDGNIFDVKSNLDTVRDETEDLVNVQEGLTFNGETFPPDLEANPFVMTLFGNIKWIIERPEEMFGPFAPLLEEFATLFALTFGGAIWMYVKALATSIVNLIQWLAKWVIRIVDFFNPLG